MYYNFGKTLVDLPGESLYNNTMKVYINKYRNHWLSPYTIMDKVLFWKKWTDPEFDLYDDKNNRYTDWLLKPCTVLQKGLAIVHPKIDYVKIDHWDTWSMDHTLAHIVLPMLKQLKATKHGAPSIDDEDVPEGLGLRSTEAPPKENEWDTDANHFKRWDWVLDQMIHAFECKVDDSWQDQYRSGDSDMKSIPCEWDAEGKPTLYQLVSGPNDTYVCDYDAMREHQTRISNGFRLFGKYFESLWD